MSGDSGDHQLPVTCLQQFAGTGRLRCRHDNTWDCTFTITRLLNGRLQIRVVADVKWTSSKKLSDWLRQCQPFKLEGTDEHGNQITALDIYFTRSLLLSDILLGYAYSSVCIRNPQPAPDTITHVCELTGFRCKSLAAYPLAVQIAGFPIEIGRLAQKWEVDEHSIAYQYESIVSYLQIGGFASAESGRALECARSIVELLSIAQRRYVFLAAQHKHDSEGRCLESQFDEPAFARRGWPRPLIPDESILEFLTVAYPHLEDKYQRLELANVIDHYLQALMLRSAWPSSLGIFTAMETLRAAFFRQSTDAADKRSEYWVVPDDDFKSREDLFSELINLLGNHFPKFGALSGSERQSLKAQLKNLNRRSYKTQLRRMLDRFSVDYDQRELQPFIDIRNRMIHYGTPARGDMPAADYSHMTSEASRRINDATSLFERALLAVLGYTGPRELFNAEEGRIHA